MCEGCKRTRVCRTKPTEFEEGKRDAIRGIVRQLDETTSICYLEGAIRGLEIFQDFLSSPHDHPPIIDELAEEDWPSLKPDLVFCPNMDRAYKPFRKGNYRPDLSRLDGTYRTEDDKALH